MAFYFQLPNLPGTEVKPELLDILNQSGTTYGKTNVTGYIIRYNYIQLSLLIRSIVLSLHIFTHSITSDNRNEITNVFQVYKDITIVPISS